MQTDSARRPRLLVAAIVIWNVMMTLFVAAVCAGAFVLIRRDNAFAAGVLILTTLPLLAGFFVMRGSRRNDTLAVATSPEDERQRFLRYRAKSFAGTCIIGYALVCINLGSWQTLFPFGIAWGAPPLVMVQMFMAGLLWVYLIAFFGASWFFSRRS